MARARQRGILSLLGALALLGAVGCNPLNLKWSPDSGDTVAERLQAECLDSGGEWTPTGCDPPLPWRR